MSVVPNLAIEAELAASCGGAWIAGMDEVGRGALAGPVAVGVAAVDMRIAQPLDGLKDSKKMTALQRERLAVAIPSWATTAVGMASPEEIDTYGLSAALGLAGRRAWHQIVSTVGMPHGLILDGNSPWLNAAPADLVGSLEPVEAEIVLQTKADATCCTVSAAAITAKVARDALMAELGAQHPGYGWESNKGYGSVAHREALHTIGITQHHRKSWNLVPAEIQPRLL